MIGTIDLRGHIVAVAEELDLPLTIRQVNALATLVAARAAGGQCPQRKISRQMHAVLVGLASGEDVAGTAARLGVSRDTVKSHRYRLYRVLGAASGAHAVAVAISLGILAPAGGAS